MSIFRHTVGIATTFLFLLTTLLAIVPLLPLALAKWVIPAKTWQKTANRALDWIASRWMDLNSAHQKLLTGTHVQLDGDLDLRRDEWYLMIPNHQTWVDILVILRVFNGRIPYVKFFLKKSLIWVPFLGLAWWALEFPFMRRYSKDDIARNPALKGRDIEETRRACAHFAHDPVTIINFVEGTRFTPQKHAAQASPYRHLLIPKAGGIAFTLAAMDGQLHTLLDLTLYYPDGRPSYWEYASGRVRTVRVHVRQRPIPANLLGDYDKDPEFREAFQQWLNQLWREKDDLLVAMAQERSSH